MEKKCITDFQVDKSMSFKLSEYEEGDKFTLASNAMFDVMFANDSRIKYVKLLIEYFLDKKVDSIELIKRDVDKNNIHDKLYKVDLAVKVEDEYFLIEVNNSSDAYVVERNFMYATEFFGKDVKSGSSNPYNYKKVLQLNIQNFSYVGRNKVMDEFYLQTDDCKLLTDKLKIVFIYLPILRRKMYNKEELSLFEKYLLVLFESEKKTRDIRKGFKEMEEYVKDAIEASSGNFLIKNYWTEEEMKLLRQSELSHANEEGYQLGEKAGEKNKAISTAKKMLKNKLSIKLIQECTGLSQKEIKELM